MQNEKSPGTGRPAKCEWLLITIGVLLIAFAYASLIYPKFAVLDDVLNVYEASTQRHCNMCSHALAEGRVLPALGTFLTFSAFPSLDGLHNIRLVSLFFICCTFSAWYVLLRCFFVVPAAFLIGVATMLLPPFVVAVLWASAATYPLIYLLAVLAMLALDNTLRRVGELDAPLGTATAIIQTPTLILAFVLVLLSFFGYPPAAQVFLCLPMLYVCRFRAQDNLRRTVVCYLTAGVIFIVTATIFYLVWQIYKHYFYFNVDPGQRTIITSLAQLEGKLDWFFHEVALNAGNLFKLQPSKWVMAAVYGVIALYFAVLPVSLKERAIRACLWLSLYPATHLANLLAQESWANYRTQSAIQTYVFVSFAGALWHFSERVLASGQQLAKYAFRRNLASVIVVLALVFHQAFIVGPSLTQPHVEELLVLRDAVRDFEQARKPGTRLVIVRPHWDAQKPALIRYDLIGVPASQAPWGAIPFVKDLYLDLYRRALPVPVIDMPVEELANFRPNTADYIMNLDALLRAQAKVRNMPILKEPDPSSAHTR